jgi:DNA-directed RNA polymerase specialized sigma subunit
MKSERLFRNLDPKKIGRSLAMAVPTWERIWKACWPKVRRRRPSNWSLADWRELMLAEAFEATCLALVAFDGRKGLTLDEYVRLCIQNALVHASQKERSFTSHLNRQTARELAARASSRDKAADDRLQWLVNQLSKEDRLLVAEIFISGKTEAEIATALGKGQQWVSKHKVWLLNKMRKIGENWEK